MCFSATASFVASGLLMSAGAVVLTQYSYTKKEMPLAVIPIIFGVHQFSEGLVWLGVSGTISSAVQFYAIQFFTFIAMCFWPIFIPAAVLIYEYPKKRKIFFGLLFSGMLLSLYLLYCFTIYSELYLDVNCCNSLGYIYRMPFLEGKMGYFYVFIVVASFLFSSNLRIRYVLGPVFLASYLLAMFMESGGDYPSIWCFFAAIISVCIYYALHNKHNINIQSG